MDAPSLTDRLRALRDALGGGLVERDVAVRLALLAALAGEHLLLVGPPGTGRRAVARRLPLAFVDATFFERHVTPTTTADEVFGPGTEGGRRVDGYLPSAGFAFLDGVLEAGSAVRNGLLTLLDERILDDGPRRHPAPLVTAIAATTEPPPDADALADRFLLRLRVDPVSDAAFPRLLAARDAPPWVPVALRLSADDRRRLRAEADTVDVPDAIIALLAELRAFCAARGIVVSDRRWRRAAGLLRVAAAANGRRAVAPGDCALLRHCLWTRPEQAAALDDWWAARAVPEALGPIEAQVAAWEAALAHRHAERAQARDEAGRPLYVQGDGTPTTRPTAARPRTRHGEALYLAPPGAVATNGLPVTDRTRGDRGYTLAELDALRLRGVPGAASLRPFRSWPGRSAYLADPESRLLGEEALPPSLGPAPHDPAQVADALAAIDALGRALGELRETCDRSAAAADDLWGGAAAFAPTADALRGALAASDALAARLAAARGGFAALPLSTGAATTAR